MSLNKIYKVLVFKNIQRQWAELSPTSLLQGVKVLIVFLLCVGIQQRGLGQSCTSPNYIILSEEVTNMVDVIDFNTKQPVTSCLTSVTGSEGVAVNNSSHTIYIASTIYDASYNQISAITVINGVTKSSTVYSVSGDYYFHDAVLSLDNNYLYVAALQTNPSAAPLVLRFNTSNMSLAPTVLDLSAQFPGGYNTWGITFYSFGAIIRKRISSSHICFRNSSN